MEEVNEWSDESMFFVLGDSLELTEYGYEWYQKEKEQRSTGNSWTYEKHTSDRAAERGIYKYIYIYIKCRIYGKR